MDELVPVSDEESQMSRTSWGGAAERGLAARKEREAIIASVLKDGADFGTIPGTQKPTLLKPGAEKIADSLNLYPAYEPVRVVEDWDRPLFHYAYRCILRARGTNSVIATGIGSCNTMESRYRWRDGKRKCPNCQAEAIIKGKEEYGGGWLCYAKKGGCGSKFLDDAASIVDQKTERVPNDDVFSLVNTVDKMAQKRALVAAALNLGFSEQFTQDLEDVDHEPAAPKPQAQSIKPPQRASAAPRAEPKAAEATDAEQIAVGTIEKISAKGGTSKAGKPFTRYGLLVNGEWYNTFSDTIADGAKNAGGDSVEIEFKQTSFGRDIVTLKTSLGTFASS